ncbi:response regulator [Candidatus Berkelbacteria bacterium]|nr:response regulator [Candidatus Berkelbacteria bacterium]
MKKTLILIIDDDITLRDMYAQRLTIEGFDVALAHNGPEGIAMAQTRKPNLILLDIMLPAMNGYEVASKLAEHQITRNIPILFLTALVTETERKRANTIASAKGFLIKSEIRPKEIIDKINAVLKKKS